MPTCVGADWAGKGWFAVALGDRAADHSADEAGGSDAADSEAPPNGPPANDVLADLDVPLDLAVDVIAADVYPTLLAALDELSPDLLLADVPIGLAAGGRRACDAAARAVLGDRASSVFPVPCRAAVRAPTYAAAKAANERRTGRSVTVQAWNVVPQIREADALLSAVPAARASVREAHPEVCLWALAGGTPAAHPKADPAGVDERLATLGTVDAGLPALYEALVGAFVEGPPPHARRLAADGHDDVLDALALAASVWLGTAGGGSLATLPGDPPTDARGLPMEIVYPDRPGLPDPDRPERGGAGSAGTGSTGDPDG